MILRRRKNLVKYPSFKIQWKRMQVIRISIIMGMIMMVIILIVISISIKCYLNVRILRKIRIIRKRSFKECQLIKKMGLMIICKDRVCRSRIMKKDMSLLKV